ncbi:hypothetical protein B0H13DRAFT_2272285 [Mycena leptocephala]|nr:hypothetical protein B0H13DRAFT_2272285 [Mycena leptocephala]
MTSTTNTQNKTSSSASIGTKLKGGVQVAKGLGDSVRGTTFAAIDSVEQRDSSINDEIARRGRMEIEQGIAMIKGRPFDTTTLDAHSTTTNNSVLVARCKAGDQVSTVVTQTPQQIPLVFRRLQARNTHRVVSFPASRGRLITDLDSTNAKTDLGRGPNAYSGNNTEQPPQYPLPGGPSPQDYKGGMGTTHPTQMGTRPTADTMVGEQGYQQRQDADQAMH